MGKNCGHDLRSNGKQFGGNTQYSCNKTYLFSWFLMAMTHCPRHVDGNLVQAKINLLEYAATSNTKEPDSSFGAATQPPWWIVTFYAAVQLNYKVKNIA